MSCRHFCKLAWRCSLTWASAQASISRSELKDWDLRRGWFQILWRSAGETWTPRLICKLASRALPKSFLALSSRHEITCLSRKVVGSRGRTCIELPLFLTNLLCLLTANLTEWTCLVEHRSECIIIWLYLLHMLQAILDSAAIASGTPGRSNSIYIHFESVFSTCKQAYITHHAKSAWTDITLKLMHHILKF